MSEPRLRLAVLGCGQAAVLAARALRDVRGVSCAYASRQPERAARFAQKLGGRAFGSYEQALTSADVDAVLVATPPASHFELALRGLRLSRVYGREGSIAFESNGLFLATWGRVRRLAFPGLRDISGRRAMWADFVPALQENREPQYDLRHARRDLELVEAVYASAQGGGRRA